MANIKTTRYDIGAEVLSILTRGMYPDPKDTIREYVQNGIDAGSETIHVRVRKNSITIEDSGAGMDYDTLRKAARIGVSDKSPGKDVGFMGIGIYSAFHLCDTLTIYSHKDGDEVCFLVMDFASMKDCLEKQNTKRANNEISGDELLDLQTLLDRYIIIGETTKDEYPDFGTTVVLDGLQSEFLEEFSDFDKLADYLREVIPLKFDELNFKWANLIEEKLTTFCNEKNAKFELVKLMLQVNNKKDWLYRPYKDCDFSNDSPLKPEFIELEIDNEFFGVIWGCHNSSRNKISNKYLRGFLIKKQGFAIGNRLILSNKIRPVYYDRYIGEVVVVHDKLLPNAARNDFAYSLLRTRFYDIVSKKLEYYNTEAHDFQEFSLGDEQLDDSLDELKEINQNFSLYSKDANGLIDLVIKLRKINKQIDDRKKRGSIRPKRIKDADKLIASARELESSIQGTIEALTEKRKKITKTQKEAPKKVSKRLSSIKKNEKEVVAYENLVALLESIDVPLNSDVTLIFQLIDETIIQALAENNKHYHEILKDLQNEIEELIS